MHINTKSKCCEHTLNSSVQTEQHFEEKFSMTGVSLTEIKPLFVYLVVCLEFVVQTVEQRFEEEFRVTSVSNWDSHFG